MVAARALEVGDEAFGAQRVRDVEISTDLLAATGKARPFTLVVWMWLKSVITSPKPASRGDPMQGRPIGVSLVWPMVQGQWRHQACRS